MGCPSPPPPPRAPSPLTVVPPPDQRDLQLAYLRAHVAGLARRSKNPTPPPRSRRLKCDTTPLLIWLAGQRRRLRQRRCVQPNPERTAVPWPPDEAPQ